MNTSIHTFTKHFESLTSEIAPEAKAYWRARLRHAVHDALWQQFSELAADRLTSKKSIAARLGAHPAQVTRWMNFPGNLTLDTVSDLFLAMNCTPDVVVCRIDRERSNKSYILWGSSETVSASSRDSPITKLDTTQGIATSDTKSITTNLVPANA
jgi:hypothetical protein